MIRLNLTLFLEEKEHSYNPPMTHDYYYVLYPIQTLINESEDKHMCLKIEINQDLMNHMRVGLEVATDITYNPEA